MHVMRSLLCTLSLFLFSGILAAQVSYSYQFYSTSGAAFATASGDFNLDGWPDLAVGTARSAGSFVDVFFNDGGRFVPFTEYPVDFSPAQIIAADFNGDGFLDLVVSFNPGSSSGVKYIDILMNNGDGTFFTGRGGGAASPVALKAPQAGPIAAGDFNGDGKVDLVVDEINTTTNSSQFEVLLGNGDGTFRSNQVLTMAHLSSKPVVADFNHDGKLDIANTEGTQALIWWGNGNGTFATPTKFTIPGGDLTSADFNNDGLPDLAFEVAHPCGSACGNNTVYIYKNNGNKTFTRVSSFTIGPTAGGILHTADLNGDGNQDIINDNQAHFGGGVVYALGKGNGTFGTQGSFNAPDTPFDFLARDFDLESRKDIAMSGQIEDGVTVGLAITGFTDCAPFPPSATLAAKICTPANNASVTSPVTVRATGSSPAGVKRLEIWIDGVKKYQRLYDQVAKSFTLAAGTHRITVVAVDQYVGAAKTTATVSVH